MAAIPPPRDQRRALHPRERLLWYDHAEMWLGDDLGRLLDYGCGEGKFLKRIAGRARELWGADVDPERLAEAAALPGVRTRRLVPGEALPFEDACFDCITMLEVIEHVADEREVLQELTRVLAPGGRLLLTTPHKGLLTFLDPGNFKFVAPGLHRFIHVTLLRRSEYYERKFGDRRAAAIGMRSEFTTDQDAWHRHYRYRQIRALAPPALETVAWAVYFPAFRALWTLELGLSVLSRGHWTRLPAPLRWLDDRLSRVETRLGDQLVVLFRKHCGEPTA